MQLKPKRKPYPAGIRSSCNTHRPSDCSCGEDFLFAPVNTAFPVGVSVWDKPACIPVKVLKMQFLMPKWYFFGSSNYPRSSCTSETQGLRFRNLSPTKPCFVNVQIWVPRQDVSAAAYAQQSYSPRLSLCESKLL